MVGWSDLLQSCHSVRSSSARAAQLAYPVDSLHRGGPPELQRRTWSRHRSTPTPTATPTSRTSRPRPLQCRWLPSPPSPAVTTRPPRRAASAAPAACATCACRRSRSFCAICASGYAAHDRLDWPPKEHRRASDVRTTQSHPFKDFIDGMDSHFCSHPYFRRVSN
ncbi:hypothetical protein FOCC_FOCC003416 [Frankliniella occidentalis]|nr:hypothetical protein FOCC_FOCC003416 [Frankliniella occidentalis]